MPLLRCGHLSFVPLFIQVSCLSLTPTRKKEPQHLKVGRPMGHIIENQCLNGLIRPYCEITVQHIFSNQASTQWEKDEVPSWDVLLSVGLAQCEGAWMWVVGALGVQCVCTLHVLIV